MDELLSGAGAFFGAAIRAFVDGDDSAHVRRVIEILPPELRTRAERERQIEAAQRDAAKALEERGG